jgi:hypothetical protein
MEHPFRAPGLLVLSVSLGFHLSKAGQKAGIRYQFACTAMVGVAVGKGIGQHYIGLVMTYVGDYFALVLFIILKKAIGHFCVFAYHYPHGFGGICGFLQAYLCGATGAQFALRQVQYAHLLAHACVLYKGAGTAKFYIIGVNSYGKDVEFLHGAKLGLLYG